MKNDKDLKNKRDDEELDEYFGSFDDYPEEGKFDRFIGHEGDLEFKPSKK